MALTPNSDDLDIIAALADLPNDENGLTASEFKAKFDQGPNALKTYINSTLISEIEAQFETKDDLTNTRKLSATGDFTGTLNGYTIVAADPGISSTVSGLKADNTQRAYNVMAAPYNAAGDGTTDDTTAIQAANTAAAAAGGIVYYPITSAHYKITDEIAVSSNVQHISDGATIKQYTTGKAVFTVTGKSNVKIKGLKIKNSRLGSGSTLYVSEDGIRITGTCSDIDVEDCQFEDIGRACIWAKTTTRLRIRRCKVLTYTYAGILVNGGCDKVFIHHCSIEGCTITTTSCYGIAIGNDDLVTEYSRNVFVHHNYIKGVKAWNGLDIHGGENIQFTNNIVEDCRRGCEAVIGYTNSPTPYMKNILIQGNKLSGALTDVGTAPEGGIFASGSFDSGTSTTYVAENVRIIGNEITGFNKIELSGSEGGLILTYINGFTVMGNTIYDNRIGVNFVRSVTNGVISGNSIYDNSTYGMVGYDASTAVDNVLIENNRIGGSGLAGLSQSYGMIASSALTCVVRNNDFRGNSSGAFDGTAANWGEIAFNTGTGFGTRKETLGSAAPTTGTWAKGDICWNTDTSLGVNMGWVCSVAGTPGTWQSFGIIGAVKVANQADSVAADVATLVSDFNALLAKLQTAKIMS